MPRVNRTDESVRRMWLFDTGTNQTQRYEGLAVRAIARKGDKVLQRHKNNENEGEQHGWPNPKREVLTGRAETTEMQTKAAQAGEEDRPTHDHFLRPRNAAGRVCRRVASSRGAPDAPPPRKGAPDMTELDNTSYGAGGLPANTAGLNDKIIST